MRSRRALACIAAMATAVLGLTGCGSAGSSRGTIQVGAVYPDIGTASVGADELAGVRTAADLANAAGGVRGQTIGITARDAPDPTTAQTAVDQLADQGVQVILGTNSSAQAITATARASQRGLTYLETGALADVVTRRDLPGILRVGPDGSSMGAAAMQFVAQVILPAAKLTPANARIVALIDQDPYGASVATGALQTASSLGLASVQTITYPLTNTDYTAIVSQVKADRADVIVAASYLTDAVSLRRAAAASHIAVRAIVGTSSSYAASDFGAALGGMAVGVFAVDKPGEGINAAGLPAAVRPLLAQALDRYHAAYGRPMSDAAMSGFVGGWVAFHDILPQAPTLSQADVWKAATALDLPAGSEINGGGVRFAPQGDADAGQNHRAATVVWEWTAPGQRRVVFPAPFAQSPPQLLPLAS